MLTHSCERLSAVTFDLHPLVNVCVMSDLDVDNSAD